MDLNVQYNAILFVFLCLNVYMCVLFYVHLRIIRALCAVFCMRCVFLSGWQVPKTHFKNRIWNSVHSVVFVCMYIYSCPFLSMYIYSLRMWCICYMPVREHESYTKERFDHYRNIVWNGLRVTEKYTSIWCSIKRISGNDWQVANATTPTTINQSKNTTTNFETGKQLD